MRRLWLSAMVAGCSFQPGQLRPDGGDDPDTLVLPEGEHWVFDTAAELGAPGYTADALVIESRGALTPVGYIYGGLLMRGKQDTQLWAIATPTIEYAATEAITADGVSLWNTDFTDTSASFVAAGITANTTFTLWFEGEVYLDAGDIVSVRADGAGFVDLLVPSGWVHIESRTDGIKLLPAVATAGWYQVRLGWGEGTSYGFLDFRRGPSGTAVHYTRDRLRTSVSTLRGTMREAFYRQIFGGTEFDNGVPVAALEATGLLPATTFATSPPGAGATFDWSARWYGQFYAAVAGTYSLSVDSDDGNQLMLAGVIDSDLWVRGGASGTCQSTVQADLGVGWHDVVLDYNQVGGNRAAALQVLAAPEPALVGSPIPLDRLRPVEPRRDRLISETRKFVAVSVPNNATGPVRNIQFDGFAGEVVTAIDISVDLDTQHLDELQFFVTRPGGAPTLVLDHPPGAAHNGHYQVHVTTAGVVGQPLPGMWSFQIQDNTGAPNTTSFDEIAVTIHTTGGPGQVATESTWISPVRDAGAAPVQVIDVVWTERAPIASEIYVRACAVADCSDDPPWGSALGQHGTAELATAYLQAKVVMHSDGTVEPELDALAITYRN